MNRGIFRRAVIAFLWLWRYDPPGRLVIASGLVAIFSFIGCILLAIFGFLTLATIVMFVHFACYFGVLIGLNGVSRVEELGHWGKWF